LEIGAAGTVLLGVLLFGESVNLIRFGGVFMIVIGIIAVKLAPAVRRAQHYAQRGLVANTRPTRGSCLSSSSSRRD
jgi:hypothetical protein